MTSFWGYTRPDGSIGIRNTVAIISVMDTCNPVTKRVAAQVQGTTYLPGSYIRGQLGRDRAITLQATAGLCVNPNVYGAVVIGLEPRTTQELVALISASGKPVASLDIQAAGGTIAATAAGVRLAAQMVREASRQRRIEQPLSALRLAVECGGSDTTSGLASNPSIGQVSDFVIAEGGSVIISETSEFFGAEHLFADRSAKPAVRKRFLQAVDLLEREIKAQGVDLRGSNPTPDNIRGGLTTIEEKALGAMAKAGTTPLMSVVGYGEAPVGSGLHFMTAPAPAVESITGFAAAGCQLCLFSTGVGNPIGHPIMTVVKVSGNRNTIDTFSDNIDFDATSVVETGEPISAVGKRLFYYAVSVASGELTSSEVLDVRESAISRFGQSM